MAWHNWQN